MKRAGKRSCTRVGISSRLSSRRNICWTFWGLVLIATLQGCAAAQRTSRPPGAALQVKVPAGDNDAELWVDGNYVGQIREIDKSPAPLRLAPGRHRIEVRKPGRFPAQRSLDVSKEAKTVIVETTLPANEESN